MHLTRTTLDSDVPQAAKEIAAMRQTTTGKVLAELARGGLEPRRDAIRIRKTVFRCCQRAPARGHSRM